ncbi:malate synthase G [Thalassovita mediterranea]|jgi:malate synthase|uniref:Malate synthase G n=1 Tax=Thalassovita mediterranea TaxID=340021 RepID=A0A0P1GPP0_9RHOB|nr:malate synthase G [Thalassovita mediterranea]CUH84327.1 Malate synthase G [Thalassovita mediterranea]SIS31867.1 malate synthase [Thalassovita mediterranea]
MTTYVTRAGLDVAAELAALMENDVFPGLGLDADAVWSGYAAMLTDMVPENRRLLAVREEMQRQIDAYVLERKGQPWDGAEYEAFLRQIGYLVEEGEAFEIETAAVDPEIASVAGPQLVVPVMNARFALNAANARWGSLYDALYGTDALPGAPEGKGYDPKRGAQAVAWSADFLDKAVPLAKGSHADVTAYRRDGAALVAEVGGETVGFADAAGFVGYTEEGDKASYVLVNNGMHIELLIDPSHPVGAAHAAGLRDVVLESALTAIQDCEDSVAAVDAEDKVTVYGNWLGLMKGDLAETFTKGGQEMTRRLNADKVLTGPEGGEVVLPGRAVLLVRNVGHLMTTDAVKLNGEETPEGMLDALCTVACAMHDLQKTEGPRNSRAGSVYVVKPKMHGPEEVAFADQMYGRVEQILGLAANTVKLGVMDEERRTSANLRECIRQVKDRLVFINTGFLDRTGDEIHTSMQAGAFIPKDEMKTALWLTTYENGNVDAGLATGMQGKGQIGKGMWAKPDMMDEMLDAKIGHPKSGANTAWVPSPTAATLHATHYHQVDVFAVQDDMKSREAASLSDLLMPPLLAGRNLTDEEVRRDLDNNCQGILGYVVRWVDQGVGCSKVPDINDVGLMEDRATLRISSQYLANWLLHGLVTEEQVMDSLKRMAQEVDRQNVGDAAYTPMAPGYDGVAFAAACDLIFKGVEQPSGYTEPVLHARRREAKALQA